MVKFPGGTQTRAYSALFNSMAYVGQNGVKTGCLVTEDSPLSMNVKVASGSVFFASSTVSVTGADVTIGANTTSYERLDVVRVNNSGTLSVVAGTAASIPLSPEYDPENYVALALVRVEAGATTITTSKITDARSLNTSGGASGTSFTGLSDTPSTMVAQGGKTVKVNTSGTALEFGIADTNPIYSEFEQETLSVSTTSTSISYSANRVTHLIKNIGTDTCYINFDLTATINNYPLRPNDILAIDTDATAIHAICDTGDSTIIRIIGQS